jgi:carbamoyl-phosphate synthase large subunit
VVPIARRVADLGFRILATRGTRDYLAGQGVQAEPIFKIQQGRPNILDAIKNSAIDLMINTPAGEEAQADDARIRRAAIQYGLPYTTTLAGASAAVSGIESLARNAGIRIRSLQEFHAPTRSETE